MLLQASTINLPGPGPEVAFRPSSDPATVSSVNPPVPVVVDFAVDRAASY